MGENWDAHHTRRYADGGVTELPNAMALCERCHVLIHRRIGVIKPRGWQRTAIDLFREHREKCFLLDATPGSGKTIFSALCFKLLAEMQFVDFAIPVVPTTALKGDADAGFLGDWFKAGIELTPVLKDKRGPPSEFQGGIICYHQLPNIISTLETWAGNGVRLMPVFDEIHHLRENAAWGIAADRLARCSRKILGMTGTLFRGDGHRISFVNYDDEDKAIADYRYSYRTAVRASVCRPVDFPTDDGIAEFIRNDEAETVRISKAGAGDDARSVTNTIFRSDANWLRAFLERADESLEEYRIIDPSAGGLVVCRPGADDEASERYLRQVAKLLREVTGEEPEVISHEDPDSNAKIEKFRKSRQKWICAVRKISEGVDIKRLCVLVMAMRPTTELLFRQLVGRIVRVQDSKADPRERATAFIAKFPQLQEWAASHSDEAQAGLRDEDEDRKRVERENNNERSSFVAIGSSHEDGGAVSEYGDEFTAAEINAAEREKLSDPQLSSIPITTLAYLRRKHELKIDPLEMPNVPLQVEKKNIRRDINKLVRRVAIRRDPANPNFKKVWIDLHNLTGARDIDDLMDNHPVEVMRQAQRLLESWLGKSDAAA